MRLLSIQIVDPENLLDAEKIVAAFYRLPLLTVFVFDEKGKPPQQHQWLKRMHLHGNVHAEVQTNDGRIDAVVELSEHIYLFEFKLDKSESSSEIGVSWGTPVDGGERSPCLGFFVHHFRMDVLGLKN